MNPKKKPNPDKKKKPMNAFFVYRKALRDRIIHKYNTKKSNEISKIAGECWALEPIAVKNMFRQISIKLHENARDLELGKPVEPVDIPVYVKEPASMSVVDFKPEITSFKPDTEFKPEFPVMYDPHLPKSPLTDVLSPFIDSRHEFGSETDSDAGTLQFNLESVFSRPLDLPTRPHSAIDFTPPHTPISQKRLSAPMMPQMSNPCMNMNMNVHSVEPLMTMFNQPVAEDILAIKAPTLRTWKSDSSLNSTMTLHSLDDWSFLDF